jgi:hypothetical protein
MTETVVDLSDPAFAPIKARLARTYLQHKADLGVADVSDVAILQRIDGITLTLLQAVGRAVMAGDEAFLERNAWFIEIAEDLMAERPAKLDG